MNSQFKIKNSKLKVHHPLKEVFIFLQPLTVEAVDALATLVGGRYQASALQDVKMPRCERLAQNETI
jgi:hypothetical protein